MDKIKPEEKKKYENMMGERVEEIKNTQSIESKFTNGLKVLNDIENNDIILIQSNSKKTFSVKSLLPTGVRIQIDTQGGWWADGPTKIVHVRKVMKERDLLSCLHEIGHMGDFHDNYENLYKAGGVLCENNWDKDIVCEVTTLMERNSWAGALKIFRKLQREGYIDKSFSNNVIIDEVKSPLYDHARSHNSSFNSKFLNKEL